MPGYLFKNNKLDRANKTLKDDYTLSLKLGMTDLNKMQKAGTSWFLNEGRDSFKDHEIYCLRNGTDAWQWYTANLPSFRVIGANLSGSILGAGSIAPSGVCSELDDRSSS